MSVLYYFVLPVSVVTGFVASSNKKERNPFFGSTAYRILSELSDESRRIVAEAFLVTFVSY